MKMFGRNNNTSPQPAPMDSYDEMEQNMMHNAGSATDSNIERDGEQGMVHNPSYVTDEDSSYGPEPPPPPPGNEEYVQPSLYDKYNHSRSQSYGDDGDDDESVEVPRDAFPATLAGDDVEMPSEGNATPERKRGLKSFFFGTRASKNSGTDTSNDIPASTGEDVDDGYVEGDMLRNMPAEGEEEEDSVPGEGPPASPEKKRGLKNLFFRNRSTTNNETAAQNIDEETYDNDVVQNMPLMNEAPSRTRDLDDDDDDNEEISVEIPPTTVVQRMIEKEKRGIYDDGDVDNQYDQDPKEESNSFRSMVIMGVCCLVIIAVILAAGFGTGKFNNSKSSSAPSTPGGSSEEASGRAADISSYLSSIAYGGADSINDASSPEGMASAWLIAEDPLQLSADTDQEKLAQRYALLTLWFNSKQPWTTETPGWIQSSTGNEDECTWYGVKCASGEGNQTAAVTEISLPENNLQGNLPADLSLLSSLHTLNLQGNAMTGPLPPTLPSKLKILNLGGSQFSGSLSSSTERRTQETNSTTDAEETKNSTSDATSGTKNSTSAVTSGSTAVSKTNNVNLTSLTNLEVLVLSDNNFTGTIPDSIGELVKLQELDLSGNSFSGEINEVLGELTNLVALRLGNNGFDQGEIPIFIYTLMTLEELSLDQTNREGAISPAIGSLTNLKVLNLSGNFLNGELSTRMGSLAKLVELQLNGNLLSGSLPDMFEGMTELMYLRLSRNSFTGQLPDSLGTMANLVELELNQNTFWGSIPTTITGLLTLETLDMSRNGISGNIPSSVGGMYNLKFLALNNNARDDIQSSGLSGEIPTSLGNLERLEFLDLHANLLTGTLPDNIGGLVNITFIDVEGNMLNGPIPDSISNWTKIQEAYLFNNDFTGSVPEGICDYEESITNLIADCDITCTCCTSCGSRPSA